MIDFEQIRKYFRDTIIAADIFPANGYDWENVIRKEGDPYPDLWMRENYLSIDEGFSDSKNGDYNHSILQFTINVPIGTFDAVATSACVAIGNLFPVATVVSTEDYKISIISTKRSFQGRLANDSLWYSAVCDVEFKAYE